VCRCEPPPCTSDADCVVATDIDECCGSCPWAYHVDDVRVDACLVRFGDPQPVTCQPEACPPSPCPAIDCAFSPHAACVAGECVGRSECPAGTVLSGTECIPACTTDADCVVATLVGGCCGSCAQSMHRELVASRPCLTTEDDPMPPECAPDLELCAAVDCPDVLCETPTTPRCGADGLCGFSP
jgi:hypothetical protein